VLGSFAGGYGSKFLSDSAINVTYAILALIAAVMMFLPKRGKEDGDYSKLTFNKTLAFVLAAVIGIVSGIVGAAGAFITVPVMLVILRIPTRVRFAILFGHHLYSSIGSTAGKLLGGHMLLMPSIVMVIASLIAARSARDQQEDQAKALQWILIALISATVIKNLGRLVALI